jgi:hypothetical protein
MLKLVVCCVEGFTKRDMQLRLERKTNPELQGQNKLRQKVWLRDIYVANHVQLEAFVITVLCRAGYCV